MEIKAITRKWGNSIAVVIPNEVVQRERIREDQEIVITLERKRPKAGVLFGFLKDWKKSAQEIKDEARKGWFSGTDREREEQWKKNRKK